MPLLRAVIFDLDGTLLDSAPDIRQALNLTLKAYERRDVTLDEVKSIVGDGMLATLTRAFAMTGTSIAPSESYARFQEFIGHYRNLKPDPAQIYPNAVSMMESLIASGVKLGLCTNKQEASSIRLLEQLNLAKYFEYVAGGDTFPVHKPNPGHVLGVLDRLQVLAPQAVMIGDSINDVKAAQGAGVKCVAVTHGYGVDMENLGADALVPNFDALQPALANLGFTI